MQALADMVATALKREGFHPLDRSSPDANRMPNLDRYHFVGSRKYWGSMVSCGVLVLAGEDRELVAERAAEFYAYSSNLRKHADYVNFSKLGGFGVLAALIPGPSTEGFQRWIGGHRLGSAWNHTTCLVWLLDRALRQVFVHRGLPWWFYPSPKFFRRLLAQRAP
jgi:hypothetical protein